MSSPLPAAFLFRYTFPICRADGRPRTGKRILDLPAECGIVSPAQIDAPPAFGELRLGWNPAGLAISVDVRGKSLPALGNPDRPTGCDGLKVWIDTRNTQSIHRAGRFCHQFCLLPTGGGTRGDQAIGVQVPVPRAREDAPPADSEEILVQSSVRKDGYLLEAWLSADILTGYDPDAQPRLGFFYHLQDAELGHQTLSVNADFPFESDPSLWSTLELAS